MHVHVQVVDEGKGMRSFDTEMNECSKTSKFGKLCKRKSITTHLGRKQSNKGQPHSEFKHRYTPFIYIFTNVHSPKSASSTSVLPCSTHFCDLSMIGLWCDDVISELIATAQ